MVTRDEAAEAIYEVINSGILDDDLEGRLEDIASCILREKDGLHLWGADDKDVVELYTTVRSDLVTPEYEQHIDELYYHYKFDPSEQEQEDFDSGD